MQPPVRAHTQTTHGTVYTQRTLIGAIAETVFSLYSDDRYFNHDRLRHISDRHNVTGRWRTIGHMRGADTTVAHHAGRIH